MVNTLKNNRLLFIITGFLVLCIFLGLVGLYLMQPKSKVSSSPIANRTERMAIEETVSKVIAQNAEQTDDFASLVDESLITQPIESDSALLKDELAQLTEIQTQLNEQKKLLEQQQQDADKLLALKEQQLLALEKQLANSATSTN